MHDTFFVFHFWNSQNTFNRDITLALYLEMVNNCLKYNKFLHMYMFMNDKKSLLKSLINPQLVKISKAITVIDF